MTSDALTGDAPAVPVNPADPYERRAQTFPRLTDEQVERAAEFGAVQALPKGTVLFDRGDRSVDFFIVLEGSIEIYEPSPSGPSHRASRVHVLVRGTGLAATMSNYLVGRIAASKAIVLHTETEISRLEGNRHLEQVTWRNRRTGVEKRRTISNVFLMLGATPNTEWLRGCVALDETGFVRCGAGFDPPSGFENDRLPHALESSRRGVFAVGDVRAGSIKRVASSVGEGSIVVSAIHAILSEM